MSQPQSSFSCFFFLSSAFLSLSLSLHAVSLSFPLHSQNHASTLAWTDTHTHIHYPFLCNWKDALAVCHTTKMDQMAEYPWGCTSPTGRIKETSLSLSLSLCLPLSHLLFSHTETHTHTHTHTQSQRQWVRLTVPFLMYRLRPFFVPALHYNMSGPVIVKLEHLSCVSFFFLTQGLENDSSAIQ